MLCPVCQKEMYDNTVNKKNPKAPDYKCKDQTCKYELDRETGEYVTSAFVTGIWLPKNKPNQIKPLPLNTPVENNIKERAMLMAYAKDLVVAQMNNGTFTGTPAEAVIAIYEKLLAKI